MYFPILRGRQNELLAVRELQDKERLEHVTPIVEPVKASSTLLSVLEQFRDCGKRLVLVADPIVGSFEKELLQAPEYAERFYRLVEDSPELVGLYRQPGTSVNGVLPQFSGPRAYMLNATNRDDYAEACRQHRPLFTLVAAGSGRARRLVDGACVSVESAFRPQTRNADYYSCQIDFLTEEPFFYKDEGYCGFADYSIIGEEYSEGGFMPKVVALHLAQLADGKEQLQVRHFASSEKIEGSDVALKYHDALGQLLDWSKENRYLLRPTMALGIMQEYYDQGRFPGLGVAKKHAIMHHLEMVNTLLSEA